MKNRTFWTRILGLAVMVIFALAFTACEGPEGPMGPAGPQGPAGGVDPNCQHLWSTDFAVTTAPNETTDGTMKRKCIDCPQILETVTVPAWNKFYYTWVRSSTTIIIIISKTELSENTTEFEILSWNPVVNTGANNSTYPAGYSFTLKNKSTNAETMSNSFYLSIDGLNFLIGSSIYNKQ